MALDNLIKDQVIEVQDYKMKLLQAFFREDTSKWFGKAGISCHGVMWRFLADESEPEGVWNEGGTGASASRMIIFEQTE